MLIYATSDQAEKEIVTLSVTVESIRAAVKHVAFWGLLVGNVQNAIISSVLGVLLFGLFSKQHFALVLLLLAFSFRLLNRPSPIHFHVHACDEISFVTGQKERCVRHIFGFRQSSLQFVRLKSLLTTYGEALQRANGALD
jgi:hypothetical protein